ncbi:MAG: hypothetical protein KC731_35590 [Myxococcales bacterium]|nr:hypothetical protein [Myxococcales bacterium]
MNRPWLMVAAFVVCWLVAPRLWAQEGDPPLRIAGETGGQEDAKLAWWDGQPWHWEVAVASSLTALPLRFEEDHIRAYGASGGVTARVGFRYELAPRGWEPGFMHAIGVALAEVAVGRELGLDLQADYLGPGVLGQGWAVGLSPVARTIVPDEEEGVAVRLPTLVDMIVPGIGVMGFDGDVDLMLRFNTAASMLLFASGGIELSGSAGFAPTNGRRFFANVSLGMFFRGR